MDNFLVFKNKFKKEGTKQPDYKVMTREGDKFVEWGAGWIKDGKTGKYISCSKSKPREDKPDMKSNHDTEITTDNLDW